MEIKRFKIEDLEFSSKLLIEAYNGAPWECHWTMDTASTYLNEFIEAPRFVGFTLWDNNNMIGAAFCHEKTWWTDDELFIDEFYISPSHQKQGYGHQLLNHIERYIKDKKLAGFTLLTNKYMPARAFYKKNDFVEAEHVMFMYKVTN